MSCKLHYVLEQTAKVLIYEMNYWPSTIFLAAFLLARSELVIYFWHLKKLHAF